MSGTQPETMAEGWGNPDPYRSTSKFHYFDATGRSLCRKWGNAGRAVSLEQGRDEHPDNCAQCRRLRAKQSPAEMEDTAEVEALR